MFENVTSLEQAMRINRFTGIAIEDGVKRWYRNGHLHRDDGPAYASQTECRWFNRGLLHRIDGPAVERSNGESSWYIHGVRV